MEFSFSFFMGTELQGLTEKRKGKWREKLKEQKEN
jgi:hypothetical protein